MQAPIQYKVYRLALILQALICLPLSLGAIENAFEVAPEVSSRSVGGSGVAERQNLLFFGRNPALLSGIKTYSILLDHRDSLANNQFLYGGVALPLGRYSIALSGLFATLPTTTNRYQFSGAGLTVSRELFDLLVGTNISYFKSESDLATENAKLDLGILHSVEALSKSFFAIHYFRLGFKLGYTQALTGSNASLFQITPGMTVQIARSKPLKVNLFLDFPAENEFVRFPTFYGVKTIWYDFFELSTGFSGADFFSSENFHLGFAIHASYNNFLVRVDSAQKKIGNAAFKKSINGRNWSLLAAYQTQSKKFEDNVIQRVSYYTLTPNYDGINDLVAIKVPTDLKQDVIDYSLVISRKGEKKATFKIENNFFDAKSIGKIPRRLTWLGYDASNNLVDDGTYLGRLFILHKDQSITKADIAEITVNRSKIFGSIEASEYLYLINKYEKPITFKVSSPLADINQITLQVVDENNRSYFSDYCAGAQLPCSFEWWPKASAQIKKGAYQPIAIVQSESGQTGKIHSRPIIVDYFKAADKIIVFPEQISLKNLQTKGVGLTIERKSKSDLSIIFRNREGAELGQYSFKNKASLKLRWQGQSLAPDFSGDVYISLLKKEKKKITVLDTTQLFVDSEQPEIDLSIDPANGFIAGFGEENKIRFRTQIIDNSQVAFSQLMVKDKYNVPIYSQSQRGPLPPLIIWNGLHGQRNKLENDATYFVTVLAKDKAGNVAQSKRKEFTTGVGLTRHANLNTTTLQHLNQKIALGQITAYKIQLTNILFKAGTANMLPASVNTLKKKLIPILKKLKSFQVRIEGHIFKAQKNAGPNYGVVLSLNRASSIKAVLIKNGIKTERLTTKGWGAKRQLNQGRTAAEREKNRRVELILLRPKRNKT